MRAYKPIILVIAELAAVALALGGGLVIGCFVAGGSGTVNADAASTARVSQGAPVGFPYPGTTQTAHLTVTNNGNAKQYVTDVALTGWTSNKVGCNSSTDPGWFTMPAVAVAQDLAGGATSTNNGLITFVDEPFSQSVCQGATITFDYSSR